MEPARAAEALAHASASMTKPHDTIGSVAALLEDCRFGLDVDAAGIMLETGSGLELLAASSHRAAELEVHQLHEDEGPCIDAHAQGTSVQEHSVEGLLARWPRFAKTMLSAGFQSCHASPIEAYGRTIGAMGLFRRLDLAFTPEEDRVAQVFAHISSMLIVDHGAMNREELGTRVQDALRDRIVIEQAKGVVADAQQMSTADAYDALAAAAGERGMSLSAWAAHVVTDAQSRR